MSGDERSKAEVASVSGILICAAGFVLLALAGIGAAVGSAAGWDGWFRTVDIVLAVLTIPLVAIGLFLMGHPPGAGPRYMREPRDLT